MEERAREVGVGGRLSYLWPSAYFRNSSMYANASEARRAERLGLGGRIMNDIHIVTRYSADWQRNLLRFTSSVDVARAQFAASPELSFSAANLETNLFAHSMWRAVEEAEDINEFLNQHFVLPSCNRSADARGDGGAACAPRLQIRCASFCSGRWKGPTNATLGQDQELISFMPNTSSWMQPPGHLHAMLSRSWRSRALPISVRPASAVPDDRRASAQLSADGRSLRAVYVNREADEVRVRLSVTALPGGPFSRGRVTLLSADAGAENVPWQPLRVRPLNLTQAVQARGAVVRVPAVGVAVVEMYA